MKPIQEVYPDQDSEPFYGPSSYQPLLESMGYEIAVQVDDDDYQGDCRLILRDGARVGYLNFGWGSCSGCDALQACCTYQEIEKLREGLLSSVRWFESKADAAKFFAEHDWEGEHSWHAKEQAEFVTKAKQYLEQ